MAKSRKISAQTFMSIAGIALLVSVITAFGFLTAQLATVYILLVVLGLVGGYMYITEKETTGTLIAAVFFLAMSGGFFLQVLPQVPMLNNFIVTFTTFVVGLAVLPAVFAIQGNAAKK